LKYYSLSDNFELICQAKYRSSIFDGDIDSTLKDICFTISQKYKIHFLEIGVDKNHVHFLLQSVPTYNCTGIYYHHKKYHSKGDIIFGLGYAFQQTLDSKFKTINVVGNNSSFESGFSGIIEMNVNSKISESLNFVLNAKAVALSRENFFKDFDSSRRSILVRSGLFYKKVGMEYNFHQVHDLNLSADDLVDQSIMLTVTFRYELLILQNDKSH